jgi:hypothetical protein
MIKKKLKVRTSYEPNRLSKNYLPDAYERFIPMKKHQIDFRENGNENFFKNVKKIKGN